MHDRLNRPLHEGDIVLIPARITSVLPSEDYCNVSLATLFGRRPDGLKENFSAINTAVLLRHADPDDLDDIDANLNEIDGVADRSIPEEAEV